MLGLDGLPPKNGTEMARRGSNSGPWVHLTSARQVAVVECGENNLGATEWRDDAESVLLPRAHVYVTRCVLTVQ